MISFPLTLMIRSLDPTSDPPDILNPHGGPPYKVMSRADMTPESPNHSQHCWTMPLTLALLISNTRIDIHSSTDIVISKSYVEIVVFRFRN